MDSICEAVDIVMGVPQSIVLRQLLYIVYIALYINGNHVKFKNCSYHLLADDK